MFRTSLGTAAASAVAAALLLAGCSSPAPSTQPAPAPASTATTAPSVQPTEEPTEAPSSATSSEAPSSDGQAKPPKAEVVAGLMSFYEKQQALPAENAQKFATCMVDQMYDKASAATLIAMRDGDPTKIDKSEGSLIAESALKCKDTLPSSLR